MSELRTALAHLLGQVEQGAEFHAVTINSPSAKAAIEAARKALAAPKVESAAPIAGVDWHRVIRGQALDAFREWQKVTGALPRGGSWEGEIESLIANAVDASFAVAAPIPPQAAQVPTVDQAIDALVTALAESKGWLRAYGDSIIRDAIDRRGVQAHGQDERDAERYRYLRDMNEGALAIFDMTNLHQPGGILIGGHADAAIDAAMKSTQPTGGDGGSGE